MKNYLERIKGRHWVFITGFIMAMITASYSPDVAINMIGLLALIGVGILLRD